MDWQPGEPDRVRIWPCFCCKTRGTRRAPCRLENQPSKPGMKWLIDKKMIVGFGLVVVTVAIICAVAYESNYRASNVITALILASLEFVCVVFFVVQREMGRAQHQLREVTSLQRAILDSANYSIIATSADGVICTFNAAAERLL